MVELGDEHPDAAPKVFPVFYVDPRTGALSEREAFDGNVRTLDEDASRGHAVVEACAPR